MTNSSLDLTILSKTISNIWLVVKQGVKWRNLCPSHLYAVPSDFSSISGSDVFGQADQQHSLQLSGGIEMCVRQNIFPYWRISSKDQSRLEHSYCYLGNSPEILLKTSFKKNTKTFLERFSAKYLWGKIPRRPLENQTWRRKYFNKIAVFNLQR